MAFADAMAARTAAGSVSVAAGGVAIAVAAAPPVGRLENPFVFGCAPPVAASAGAASASSSTLPHKARAPPRTSITSLVGLRG